MGKSSSSSSCLKIIVCGSDSANNDNDDVHSPQAKTPSDKRGWSFRKRSGRHRVLGNNVGSETSTFADKETPQGVSIDIQSPVKPASADEKPQLPRRVEEISKVIATKEHDSESKTSAVVATSENGATCADSKVSQEEVVLGKVANETSTEYKIADAVDVSENYGNETSAEYKMADAVVSDNDVNETSAEYKMADATVVSEKDGNETSNESSITNKPFVSKDENIQSAEPNISEPGMALELGSDADVVMDDSDAVIIQTAMRGFLAQRKFVQLKSAIKLQAVIRGYLVRRSAVGTLHCIRAIVKVQALVRARSSKSLKTKPNDAQCSTVKLLQNSFARQLLESTSKPKSMNIRCNPRSPNLVWSWLERWMSVTSSETAQKLEPSVEPENENEVQKIALQTNTEFLPVAHSDSLDSKPSMNVGAKSLENEEFYVTDDMNTVNSFPDCHLSTEFMTEQSHLQKQEKVDKEVASAKIEPITVEASHPKVEPISLEDKPASPATEVQQPKLSTKRSASTDLNGEGMKFVYGSKKASKPGNPAFIAAQSKFEELTSPTDPGRETLSTRQDVEAESLVNSASSLLDDTVKKINKPGDMESSGAPYPRIHVAGSECGTELSISSTLDSPDRSDIENAEAEAEVKFLVKTSCQLDVGERQDCEANGMSPVTDIPSIMMQQEEFHDTDDISVNPVAAEVNTQVEKKHETKESDVQTDSAPVSSVANMDSSPVEQKHQDNNGNTEHIVHGSAADHQAYKSSSEASPKSHRVVSDAQGTPSSQASVNNKRNKIAKHGSNKKRSSPSAGKKSSPSNHNIVSSARSNAEHLPKEHKSGKRRNSFGSTKSDNADQEPRDSYSHNSLPSYMQATESARAKASSPRSSPDIHDKEVYSKKRHSLPGVTGKQVSPHIQRSASQAAQSAKTNGSHPSNERKWQR